MSTKTTGKAFDALMMAADQLRTLRAEIIAQPGGACDREAWSHRMGGVGPCHVCTIDEMLVSLDRIYKERL